eukprot:TRINITY_DN19729_c0_g1_i1.p2 TRINITY_DN19729_c0_g1~~TRINITY_DN19729_c0_g1_i1.p2  ORF type:complete len:307 (+),score=86.99 TRINITY_DN19729_c0_g1_i1:85-921(+)
MPRAPARLPPTVQLQQRRLVRVRPTAGSVPWVAVGPRAASRRLNQLRHSRRKAESSELLVEIKNLERLLQEAAVARQSTHGLIERSVKELGTWTETVSSGVHDAVHRVGHWSLSHIGWRGILIGICVLFGIVLGIRALRRPLARETADLTSEVVRDPKLVQEVQEKLQALVHSILHDERSRTDLMDLLLRLIRSDLTKDALVELLARLLRLDSTAESLRALLLNPVTLAALKDLLVMPQTQQGLRELVCRVLEEDELHRKGGAAVRGIAKRTVYPGLG